MYRYTSFCKFRSMCICNLHNRFCKFPSMYTYSFQNSYLNNCQSNRQNSHNDIPFLLRQLLPKLAY